LFKCGHAALRYVNYRTYTTKSGDLGCKQIHYTEADAGCPVDPRDNNRSDTHKRTDRRHEFPNRLNYQIVVAQQVVYEN
jgi:hypothetical protein